MVAAHSLCIVNSGAPSLRMRARDPARVRDRRRQAGRAGRDEVVEQPAELALDVDVAVRAPDDARAGRRASSRVQTRRRGR